MNVRHVLASETAALREIRLAALRSDPDAFGSTYDRDAARPAEWWDEWARESGAGDEQRTFVVVDDEDRWLGTSLVRADADATGSAVLLAMWVAPEARGQGAARMLCDACAAWAAEHGFGALNVPVVVENEAARRAYESAGFVFSHASTWTGGGRTLDELILTRTL